MPTPILIAILLTGNLWIPQQSTAPQTAADKNPAPSPVPTAFKSDMGFSYTYPSDWQVVDSKPILPAVHLQEEQKAQGDSEKRAVACTQIGLLLRHGSPASVILSVALPYDCFGSKFAADDLPGLGSGVASGMAEQFDIKDPVFGAYKSGTHNLWIEKAKGSPKGHPEIVYTVETVCGLLDKGMVCFMGLIKDDASLRLFEQGPITLEGDAPAALVTSDAFADAKK